jgi:hypothetical protein
VKNSRVIAQSIRQKFRDCIRIAPLLRERVLRVALNCKAPRDAEFTLT